MQGFPYLHTDCKSMHPSKIYSICGLQRLTKCRCAACAGYILMIWYKSPKMRNTSSLITRLTLAYCKHRDEARKPGTGIHICVSGGGGGVGNYSLSDWQRHCPAPHIICNINHLLCGPRYHCINSTNTHTHYTTPNLMR